MSTTNNPVILITGANTGLGYEAVKALYKSSQAYEILLGSRTVSKGDEAVATLKTEVPSSASTVSVIQIDVESDSSIEAAFSTISEKYGRLDSLINNAGAGVDTQIQSGELGNFSPSPSLPSPPLSALPSLHPSQLLTPAPGLREAWLKSWNVNVASAHVLTSTFIPLLLASSRPQLMFVTSGTSALSETEGSDYPPLARLNQSPGAGWPKEKQVNPITCYRSTKTGLNMLMREWFKIL